MRNYRPILRHGSDCSKQGPVVWRTVMHVKGVCTTANHLPGLMPRKTRRIRMHRLKVVVCGGEQQQCVLDEIELTVPAAVLQGRSNKHIPHHIMAYASLFVSRDGNVTPHGPVFGFQLTFGPISHPSFHHTPLSEPTDPQYQPRLPGRM